MFSHTIIDAAGFSGRQYDALARALALLEEYYSTDLVCDPEQVTINSIPPKSGKAFLELHEEDTPHRYQIRVDSSAFKLHPSNFLSIMGHEFRHICDIECGLLPEDSIRAELRAYRWELENAGKNRITYRFRERLKEIIRELPRQGIPPFP